MVQAVLRGSPSALACSSSVEIPEAMSASPNSLILAVCRAFICANSPHRSTHGSLVAAGTIKAYAISSAERLPALPDVPTAKEGGLDYQMNIWAGIFAPKRTPKPILAKLAAALDKSLDDPAVGAKVAELGGSIPPKSERTPAKFDRFVQEEIARWSPVLKAASAGNGAN
jgi:tripartite-type tricarboxylate transporter receptor subunit TctC